MTTRAYRGPHAVQVRYRHHRDDPGAHLHHELLACDSTLGLAFAGTGLLFPFFSAFIGWLGVILSGSDTSSNSLFGPMQTITAQQSGVEPALAGATNSSGGVMGKMISPQNLTVGASAIDQAGREPDSSA